MLRSGKFVRYFAGFTRSFIFNSTREAEEGLVQNTQCLCGALTHPFSTAVPKPTQNVDKYLKRLDQDVRRSGRISRHDIEEVLEEIRQQRSATSSQSLLVIRCCGNLVPEELPEVRTALVQEIWKTLNSLNVPMDISHYNALLRVYLENEHSFSPADFLSDLETKGVEPNRVTYQRLIARYCQQGDIDGATRILEFMREKEMPVNENVFNALILGHSQANDLESATGILGVMKQAGLEPSADTYATLLCSYARHGQLDSILKALEECDKNEIYLLDKDLLDVVYALAINGHKEKVNAVLKKLRKSAGYNQEAVNTALRLTNKGYEDVAYEVVKTMPRNTKADGELLDTGNFFIKQLVKVGRSAEKIMTICNDMKENGLHSKPLLVAVEAGLNMGAVDLTLLLLREMQKTELPLRQHYFWPLLCSSSQDGIVGVLKRMQDEFDVHPNGETLRDYVIPNLKERNPERIVDILCDAGVSPASATAAVVYHLLNLNKLKEATKIALQTKSYYNPGLFRKPLISALGKTNDVDSFLRFVRCFYDGLSRQTFFQQNQLENKDEYISEGKKVSQADQLGQLIYELVNYSKVNRVEKMEQILSGLVSEGLSITSAQAEKIQEKFGSEMTARISELLGKLSSGELEPVEVEKADGGRRVGLQNMSIPHIEKVLATAEAKNENTNGLKRTLLVACFRSKDIKKTEEVLSKLENENYVLGSGVYAQLIDLYCHHNNLEKALEVYGRVKAKEADFVLDNLKTIHVVELMVKAGKLNEAVEFLINNKKDELQSEEKNFNYKTSCWRVLNSMAETGNDEDLQHLFNTLVDNNYIEPSNVMLGPLVKVYLLEGNTNLNKAMSKFEDICNKYQVTPWKNELACRLIQAEDAANLQRLTDLSTNIHGEVNSLYDLVFSFIDCGRIRQARKILETPGLRNRPQRINAACERYRSEGMIQSLEGLIEATKDLNHIDRADIYYNLLLSYCKNDEVNKALSLWTKMQEDDITPTDAFLVKLAEFLRKKKIDIPFVVPNDKWVKKSSEAAPRIEEEKHLPIKENNRKGPSLNQYREAVKRGDIETAQLIREQLNEGTKFSIGDHSIMVEALVKAGRLNEATKYVFEMLDEKLYPVPRILKFYLNKVANAGDIGVIERIGETITDETKRLVSFDNKLCHAHIVAGNAENYLNGLMNDFDNAKTDEKLGELASKFPRGGALGILDSNPNLYPKFEELAVKYASKNYFGPINICWIYNIIEKNNESSKNLWDKYLSTHPQLMFQRVLQKARESQDDEIMRGLVNTLRTGKVSEGAIGNAYSCWLDILSTKEKFNEGLEVLNLAIKDVCLEHINRTALMRLRDGIIKSGKQFPYKIPERRPRNDMSSSSSSSTSDSSSSDDDIERVKKPEGPPRPGPNF